MIGCEFLRRGSSNGPGADLLAKEGAMAVIRNLDVVKRGVEEQLRTFAGRPSATTNELPSITAGERIEHIGNMSAKAIVEACDTTANDIEQAGQAALEIAT